MATPRRARSTTRAATAKRSTSTASKGGRSSRSAAPPRKAPRRRVETISTDIASSRRLGAGTVWVVDGEVHVRAGATLTIADGATILIANGVVAGSRLRRAALIFDPGSGLSAKRFSVRAANAAHRAVRTADNGGLWFLGTHAAGASDGIRVRKTRGQAPSSYRAASITVSHLGRRDAYPSARTGRQLDIGDDLDGLKLIGVGPDEWRVAQVRSLHSADDGFDLTNSHIRLDRLEVRNPTEDGLNLSSSRVEIRRSLVIEMPKSRSADRDLFDFETDDGGSFVELPRGCWVRVRGVFGDQLVLSSPDMPRPVTTADNERPYAFSGRLRADAVVYSVSED
jgi:hypothetical protein